jgi:uncharacterized protein (DUF4415 family)
MAKKGRIARYSADELAAMKSETDWGKVDAMTQEEVDRLADEEDGKLLPGWETTVILGTPEPKKDVHIRLDPAVLRWFKAQGPGYQTRINTVLQPFVRARQRSEQKHDQG